MREVARAACQATLGLACVIGTVKTPIRAADWTIAPAISLLVDNDSNRYLQAEGEASQSASVTASLQLQGATESTQFSLTPVVHWQDFDVKAFDRIFERDINGSTQWTGERSSLTLTGEDADQSTLTTEPTETGILSTDLHRRLDQVNGSATYGLSELRTLVLQVGYADTSYYGGSEEAALLDLLSGYREPSASLGERFSLSDGETLTASVYGTELLTRIPGDDTREAGLQLDYSRTLSERTQFEVSAGGTVVKSGSLTQVAEVGSATLSHSWSLDSLALGYSRSLTPYGTGQLFQRQQATLSDTHQLTEKLDLTASFSRVQNGQPIVPRPQEVVPEVQTYNQVVLGLDWRPWETWKLRTEVGATRTQTTEVVSQPVHEWRAAVSVSWTPHQLDRSF